MHRGYLNCNPSAKGKKEGNQIPFVLGTCQDLVTTPLGATSVNETEATKKAIELSLPAEQERKWEVFDSWAVEYLAKHSFRLFKKS